MSGPRPVPENRRRCEWRNRGLAKSGRVWTERCRLDAAEDAEARIGTLGGLFCPGHALAKRLEYR
jgi:hypothetical protein